MNVSLRLNRESLRKGMLGLVGEVVKSEERRVKSEFARLRQAQPDMGKNEYVRNKSVSRLPAGRQGLHG